MTTRTRKAPTGAKHDRCIGHVEHAYPKSGMLCIGREIGQPGMVAFADGMAASAAAHRAAFLAEPAPDGSHVRLIAESQPVNGIDGLCRDAKDCRFGSGARVHLHDVGAAHVSRTSADAVALADLVARFRAMRGLPAETPAPVRIPRLAIGRVPRRKAEPIERPEPAASSRCWQYLHTFGGTRRCTIQPDMHDGAHEYEATITPIGPIAAAESADPVAETPALCAGSNAPLTVEYANGRLGGAERAGMERCPVCDRLTLAYLTGAPREVRLATHFAAVQPEPDTYAAAVELAETRPDPCEACGHPSHGGTCAACEDAAQVGTYAPCSAVERGDPFADARAIVQPVVSVAAIEAVTAPVSGRPTCERCGQVFRKSGSGAEWHRVNRLDCARVAVAV